ncbi:immunoglobulin lambda-1 light chain-like [Denticeps clupeoides]|uniref:immunoglobulin lambda-1 light chain-like n=1 Tax=Denticeps clupeoides TaxID=299321 RepID=UPI0010A54F60|nr:immunoglobulin lambda-1 light chain-like [Denticeps clupeoides]
MIFNTTSLTALIFTLSGLEALVLTQEKTKTVPLGQNVQIHCGKDSNSLDISWYQQKPGAAPKFLLVDSTRASGLPSRFSYTDNGFTEYLNIYGVTSDDEAVYYCACVGCDGGHSAPVNSRAAAHRFLYDRLTLCSTTYFGGGTQLYIGEARPPSPPQLLLLSPSQPLPSGDRVTVACLAQGFHPDGATFSWLEDKKEVASADFQTSESQRQPDGTFSRSSVLTPPPEGWRSGHTYTCQVKHSALQQPLSKSVTQGQCS